MQRREFLLENLRGYSTLSDLQASEFFVACGQEIERLLTTAEVWRYHTTAPRLQSFLRVAQWNIEKGRRFEAILEKFESDEVLRWADVVILNETDYGMNRSGNRHIARDLAEALAMHMTFGPAHLELTKGTDEDLLIQGENEESLQGNAILSRYPIQEARLITLPSCFEPYHFHEKRYGWRNCTWTGLQIGRGTLWVGSVHLEVRGTPRCRSHQMRYLMNHLPGRFEEPHLLGGDLNSNSFSRGTRWLTLGSVCRLIVNSPAKVKQELCHPDRGKESLFQVSKDHGFHWEKLNSGDATACTPLESLEDATMLPGLVRSLVQKRLKAYEGHFHFKLDWLLGRSVQALGKGELQDQNTGVFSLAPGTVQCEFRGPKRISDHLPIYADLRIE